MMTEPLPAEAVGQRRDAILRTSFSKVASMSIALNGCRHRITTPSTGNKKSDAPARVTWLERRPPPALTQAFALFQIWVGYFGKRREQSHYVIRHGSSGTH